MIRWFGWRSPACPRPELLPVGYSQSLVKIADQVVGGFEADRQPDHIGSGAGGEPLFVGQLAVCRGGRVQD
jgi:hypothetical protein